jgi:hypothetical protein
MKPGWVSDERGRPASPAKLPTTENSLGANKAKNGTNELDLENFNQHKTLGNIYNQAPEIDFKTLYVYISQKYIHSNVLFLNCLLFNLAL